MQKDEGPPPTTTTLQDSLRRMRVGKDLVNSQVYEAANDLDAKDNEISRLRLELETARPRWIDATEAIPDKPYIGVYCPGTPRGYIVLGECWKGPDGTWFEADCNRPLRKDPTHVTDIPEFALATMLSAASALSPPGGEAPSAEALQALRDLLPYAKACVPNPINVGEENVIAKAERILAQAGVTYQGEEPSPKASGGSNGS